jgi:hypothetical protein
MFIYEAVTVYVKILYRNSLGCTEESDGVLGEDKRQFYKIWLLISPVSYSVRTCCAPSTHCMNVQCIYDRSSNCIWIYKLK